MQKIKSDTNHQAKHAVSIDNNELADPMNQSIETLANLHIHMERRVGRHQRAIETVTAFLGRPRFLYFILLFVLLWIAINLFVQRSGLATIDPPPFYWLQGLVALSALLMTTIVLITQNRQDKFAEQRRQLDLQVSLLVEQKVTKVIALLEELRQDIPQVEDRHDPESEAMKQTVDPHEVLATFNQRVSEAAEATEATLE